MQLIEPHLQKINRFNILTCIKTTAFLPTPQRK